MIGGEDEQTTGEDRRPKRLEGRTGHPQALHRDRVDDAGDQCFALALLGIGQVVTPLIHIAHQVGLIPQGIAATNDRNRTRAPGHARHLGEPLQRPRVPRVARAVGLFALGPEHIPDDHRHARSQNVGAHGRDHVQHIKALVGAIGVDAPRHAEQTREMHRQKADIEADEHQPEADPP